MSFGILSRAMALLILVIGLWWALPPTSSEGADWVAPLPEPLTVSRPFDPPENRYGPGHRGVDLAGSPGLAVRAAGAGTVVYAGPLAGRGVVSIQHPNGLRTTYEPVQASVAAGMAVSLGQVIGALDVGHAGCPVSACLHWGLRRGEVYLDPLALLLTGPVRLLPRYGTAGTHIALGPAPAAAAPLTVALLGLVPLTRRRRDREPVNCQDHERRRCSPTAPTALTIFISGAERHDLGGCSSEWLRPGDGPSRRPP